MKWMQMKNIPQKLTSWVDCIRKFANSILFPEVNFFSGCLRCFNSILSRISLCIEQSAVFVLNFQFNSIQFVLSFNFLFYSSLATRFFFLCSEFIIHSTYFFSPFFLLSNSVLFCWFVWSKYQCNENSHMINGVLFFDVFASQLICFQFNLKCWVLLIILEMSRKDIRNNDDEHIFELWTGKRAILSPLMCRHSGGFVWNFFGGVTENVVTHVNHTYDLWWYGTWTIKSFAEIKYDLYQFTCMWMRTSRKIPLW